MWGLRTSFFFSACSLLACDAVLGIDRYGPQVAMQMDGGIDARPEATTVCSVCNTSATSMCCGSECVDLSTSSTNCGACGHDCLGGSCAKGKCQAIQIAKATWPTGLAIDNDMLFITENELPGPGHGVKKCTVSKGCNDNIELVAEYRTWATQVMVDSTSVYWIDWGNVMRCSKANCYPSTPIAIFDGINDIDQPWGLAVDANYVYWTDATAGTVNRCPKTGCNPGPNVLASNMKKPTGILSDGASIYWANTDAGTVVRCATSGCGGSPATLIQGLDGPLRLVRDATNLYVAVWNEGVAKCALSGCNQTATMIASVTGQSINGVAVDATDVYFSSAGGLIMRCPIGGCSGSPAILASQIQEPRDVVVDDKAVYFTEAYTDKVWRIAK